MNVTLRLRPEIEADLLARARARGMKLEEYLLAIVEEATNAARQGDRTSNSTREDVIRRILEFGDKYRLSLGEAVTRRFLHEGHRF